MLRHLYQVNGSDISIDLVTCFAGVPDGFVGTVYRVTDYTGRVARKRLYDELRSRDYTITGILCSAEPIMTKWKWAIAGQVPAKVIVINENGDYFWFDRTNWRTILHFMLFRAGLTGAAAVPTIARLLLFPFTLGFLILYAAFVHLRRKLRTL